MTAIRKVIIWAGSGLIALVFTLVVAALCYEQFNRFIAESKFSPEGLIAQIGDHSIHYVRAGTGSPTVIFESGLDSHGHLSWFKTQKELDAFTTTVSYDRAGILWSQRGKDEKSLESISADLTALLSNINAPKPYIVVGHSAAGITLRQFIKDNQSDIAGVVLVDASNPEQAISRPPKIPPSIVMKLMSASGLIRFSSNRLLMPNTSENDRINQLGRSLVHKSVEGSFDEAKAMLDMSRSAANIGDFGNIPLIVISSAGYKQNANSTSTEQEKEFTLRERFQSELLNLSNRSIQIEAEKSGHYIQLEEPELIISAVKSVIATNSL